MRNTGLKVLLVTCLFILLTLVGRAVLESWLGADCGFWGCLFDEPSHALVDRITLLLGLFFASLVVLYVFNFQHKVKRIQQDTERRFQQLYEQATLGYLTLSMDGILLEANQAWLNMTGYDRAMVLDRPLVELLVPEDQDAFRQQFTLLQKQGWWQDEELHIKRQNGEIATVRIDGEIVVGDRQSAQVVQCIVQDISRYKRNENILARIGRQSRLLLEAAGDGICGLDRDGKVIFVNPAAEELLGYSADELMWQLFCKKVYHSHLDGTPNLVESCSVAQTLRTGEQITNRNACFWHKDGSRVPVEFISTPIQEDGQIAGAVITFRDISERLMQEEALADSEARYRSLFYNNTSMIMLSDPVTGQIVDANQSACAFYGYDREQFIGLRVHDLAVPQTPEVEQVLQAALAKPGLRIETRHRLVNGTLRDVEMYTGTVDIGGKKLLYGIIHDITERKEAEAALRLEESRLEALLELSQMSAAPVEDIADFVITQAARLTHSPVGAIYLINLDQTKSVVIHHADGPTLNSQLDPANLTPDDEYILWWFDTLQQDHRAPFIMNDFTPSTAPPAAAQAVSLVGRYIGMPVVYNDQVVAFTLVADKEEPYTDADLRQLRLLVDSLWGLLQQRQAQNKTIALTLEKERRVMLADFIEAASHEFRTPLSVINSSTYMIRRLAQNSALETHLDKIENQSAYISHLVDRMLVLLGLDKAPDSQTTRYNVNKMLASIKNDYAHEFTAANLMLALDLDRTVPDCLGYTQFLHLALLEIVENARQYTLVGGQVTLSTRHRPDWVVVTITDTGIGIAAEDLPRIFQNFYRADKARTERHAGMGLPIAQRIVEFHNGNITVESTVGQGSIFCVELPTTSSDDFATSLSPAVEQA